MVMDGRTYGQQNGFEGARGYRKILSGNLRGPGTHGTEIVHWVVSSQPPNGGRGVFSHPC